MAMGTDDGTRSRPRCGWPLRTCRAAPHIRSTLDSTKILDRHDFDGFVGSLCERFYADDGGPVGIDATTLEANAALRSIVRRDTGESYQDFLTKLAQASGPARRQRNGPSASEVALHGDAIDAAPLKATGVI
jgi:hypothetical protein